MTGPAHTVSYTYEPGRNAMTTVENRIGGTTLLSSYTYSYNELGQRADREQSGSAFASTNKDTFTYDYLGQVTASANDTETGNAYNPSYNYDEIGNRSGNIVDLNGTTGYTQDLLNQYTAVGANSPTYDDDGNLTGDGTWTYSWNGENRLVSATDGSTTIDFTYDYQGRLIEKDDGTDVEVYLYDGWNRIYQIKNPGSQIETTKSFLWGMDLSGSMQGAGGVGGLLKEGSLYPTYDANGNIVQKFNSSGVASMAVEYDPFGNIISGSLVGEYSFSTKPLIGSILMYYYGFRYYDPVTGRWPSRDPIAEQGGANLYAFVLNSAIGLIDIFGLNAEGFPIIVKLDEKTRNEAINKALEGTRNIYLQRLQADSLHRKKSLKDILYHFSNEENWKAYKKEADSDIGSEPADVRPRLFEAYYGVETGGVLYSVKGEEGTFYVVGFTTGTLSTINYSDVIYQIEEEYEVCEPVVVFHTHPYGGLHSTADQKTAKRFKMSYVILPWGEILSWHVGLPDGGDVRDILYPQI